MRRILLIVAAGFLAAGAARAQYIDPREYEPFTLRVATAGVWWRDFAPRSSNQAPDSVAIRYKRLMPLIGFRQGPVEITFGYTTFTQRDVSRTALFLGTVVSSDIVLGGGRSSALVLPLLLAADFTKAEAGGPERESFNIASVGLGAGLKYRAVGRDLELAVMAGGIAHYAIEGLSTGTGFSGALVMDGVMVFRTIGLAEGLALGYRFRLQTWALSNSRFNYRAVSHGPYLGLAF